MILKVLIFLIIIDPLMSQCGIRWRGTCNRRLVKKADDLRNFIEKGKGDETSLIRYPLGLLLLLPQNMIEKKASKDDNYKESSSSNAKRLW